MRLEINLNEIARIAKQKEEENILFRKYLESLNVDEIDEIVQRLTQEITPKIDCLQCGNCCMNLRPTANDEVLKDFVKDEDLEKYRYAMSFPCKNLDGKKCTVYLDRPEECRAYPYMDRGRFSERILGVLQNYEICPIVFNIFESLKNELAWSEK